MSEFETGLWPRAEHLHRVFSVRSRGETGSAFAVDIENKQYLASAYHVLKDATETATLEILRNKQWVPFVVKTVGIDTDLDLAVLALQEQIARPDLKIEISSSGLTVGGQVFFLGYPLNLRGPYFHPGFPIPLVSRGVVSAVEGGTFLSGTAPPGFSGGPVYFFNRVTKKANLAAVIIQSLAYEMPVRNENDEKIGKVWTDANIIQCSMSEAVLKLINTNKIGFQLS
jgi:S1-C subfamily serine protease